MYVKTQRTTASRDRGRVSYERSTAHAILDEAYDCALGFTVDGEPRVLPTLHVRVDETVYLHGSTGSRPMLAARGPAGLPVCLAVTLLDGLVCGRSQRYHSANFRSVIAHGTARPVTDETEKRRAMAALVEKVGRGRAADTRPPSGKELAETTVLALPLHEVSIKIRTGGVLDNDEDRALPYWAGVVPLRLTPGTPEPDAGVTAPVPDYLRPARSPWLTPAPLRGAHVVLEPLDLSQAAELFRNSDDAEVWRHLGGRRPAGPDDMAASIAEALRAHHRGERVPWVQRCARTGEAIGATSYYEVNEAHRSVAIGYTWLGRRWWRTGVNTEAKLMLLTRAFDVLGAVRVVWHTDIRNERSQRAIERLGAHREGVLRMHKPRRDGSWRDTAQYAMTVDQWPGVRARLHQMLRSNVDRCLG